MQISELDARRLAEALLTAREAIGRSDPNPRVGCVIGKADGQVLGVGSTQEAGGPHAEIMALRDAHGAGNSVQGATAWVTLEPCSHHGRTPPCCDALAAAGISRVVVAVQDPNPMVAGQGVARLRAAGIAVELAQGDITVAARELNIGFFSRHRRGRPWLRLKTAVSLDGRTALVNGQSQWITEPPARIDGHAWRRRAGAIVTGIGTILADDPRLDVRLVPTSKQPLRVVLDSSLRLSVAARIVEPPGELLVLHTAQDNERAALLRSGGVRLKRCGAAGERVDLAQLMLELGELQINEVHIEAGATLSGALIQSGWVDEILVYQAPVLLGPGRGSVAWEPLADLEQTPRFVYVDNEMIGADLRIRARSLAAASDWH